MKNTILILSDQTRSSYQIKIGDFFISENIINDNYPLHQQDYYELEYITEGSGEHIINNERSSVKAGDILFITPFDYHGFKANGIKTITCHFYAKDLSFEVARFLLNLQSHTVTDVDKTVAENFKYLLKVFKQNEKFAEIKLKNIIEIILLELFAKYSPEYSKNASDKISEAIGYVNLNFRNDISLKFIEEKFNISASQFSRDFKKRTGKRFTDYLTEKRLNYAKKLILNGRKIIDVCFESGFGTVRNFNRAFKKRYGVSPTEFSNCKNMSINS